MRLVCAPSASPVFAACSTQNRLITGSMPGKAASTKLTWVFGSAPKAVAAPENSLAFEMIWAWTSSPITISHVPVLPSISIASASHRRRPGGEFGGRLDHAGDAEQGLLVESAADHVQAERQPVAGQAGRHRDARQSGQVHRHRKHVVQIHRDRVIALLADGERR